MAHTDVEPIRVIHQFQEAQHSIKIVQRLTDAHEDDIGNGNACVKLGEQDLIDHLRRC